VRWRSVCRLARRLPEVEDGRSYGVRVIRVRGSFIARLAADGCSIVVKSGVLERERLCHRRPDIFAPAADDPTGSMMMVRLATIDTTELWPVLAGSWRRSAPATLVAASDPVSSEPRAPDR